MPYGGFLNSIIKWLVTPLAFQPFFTSEAFLSKQVVYSCIRIYDYISPLVTWITPYSGGIELPSCYQLDFFHVLWIKYMVTSAIRS